MEGLSPRAAGCSLQHLTCVGTGGLYLDTEKTAGSPFTRGRGDLVRFTTSRPRNSLPNRPGGVPSHRRKPERVARLFLREGDSRPYAFPVPSFSLGRDGARSRRPFRSPRQGASSCSSTRLRHFGNTRSWGNGDGAARWRFMSPTPGRTTEATEQRPPGKGLIRPGPILLAPLGGGAPRFCRSDSGISGIPEVAEMGDRLEACAAPPCVCLYQET